MSPDDQDKLAQEWEQALQDEGDGPEEAPASAPDPAPAAPADDPGDMDPGDEALANEWAAALAQSEEVDLKKEKEQEYLSTQMKDAEFQDFTAQAKGPKPEGSKRDLDFILDIPLDVSAELGRTKLLINELLQLGQGSVVELNKLAGEPLEIYVNGKLVARGEAVVINEKFGIRLTDIISPIERVKQLA
ncbi:flagellar motor switch protein FliN/FliY [Paucidesulfovibrio gracilis DSM 16080]|uniref:Flagellar motor switch protein FliN n=1 Tax=Paucidesulfovibrio gracilis DSM 16080 TaxID=1121449 RepID=A0A1T4XNB7_9BACT|nr:flagellar motor switch protein FliN [Paucidesulfovibrio gracilis]SKA91070.1 flagellar motor switch protein FliN/FliY [Paucidesulfovibrio gracilis DSM 16080]